MEELIYIMLASIGLGFFVCWFLWTLSSIGDSLERIADAFDCDLHKGNQELRKQLKDILHDDFGMPKKEG